MTLPIPREPFVPSSTSEDVLEAEEIDGPLLEPDRRTPTVFDKITLQVGLATLPDSRSLCFWLPLLLRLLARLGLTEVVIGTAKVGQQLVTAEYGSGGG